MEIDFFGGFFLKFWSLINFPWGHVRPKKTPKQTKTSIYVKKNNIFNEEIKLLMCTFVEGCEVLDFCIKVLCFLVPFFYRSNEIDCTYSRKQLIKISLKTSSRTKRVVFFHLGCIMKRLKSRFLMQALYVK